MSALRYAGLIVGFLLLSQLVALAGYGGDGRAKTAIVLGGLLATLNALAAYGLARWASIRSMRALIWAVLGGMTVRMLLLLTALAVAIAVARLPVYPLVFSLLAYFTLFLALELVTLPRMFREATP